MKTQPVFPVSNSALHRAVAIEVRLVSADQWLARRLPPTPESHRCPSCHSIIYSRRHPLCGVCSRPLPRRYLFTDAEAERVGLMLNAERQRHQQWLARRVSNTPP
jgi:hypothetical protein